MDNEYYIRHGARTQGPFSVAKLHEMSRRGRFSRAYQVSTDRVHWQRAGDFPELFPQSTPPRIRVPRSAPVGAEKERELPAELIIDPEPEELEFEDFTSEDPLVPTLLDAGALWYYTMDDADHDPVSLDQLQALVDQGRVRRDDQVWTDGMSDWMSVSHVPELSPHLPLVIDSEPPGVTPAITNTSGSPPSTVTQTAPMAVASLVLGLLGTNVLYFLGSILAVVFGHIAMRQIKESDSHLGGHGLAVSGLIFGYAVIIVTVVVGIVFFLAVLLGLWPVAAGNG